MSSPIGSGCCWPRVEQAGEGTPHRQARTSPVRESCGSGTRQVVGQGRRNPSNLRGLTDGDVEGVIGTRLTQRGSPMPVLPARTHGSFHPTVLGVTAPSTDRTHLTGAHPHAALAAVVGRAAIAVVASRSVAKYFTLADAAFALVGTRAGIAVVAGRPVGTPLAEGYCGRGRGRAGRCCRRRAGGGRRDDDSDVPGARPRGEHGDLYVGA